MNLTIFQSLNVFSIVGLFLGATSLILALIILSNSFQRLHRIWALFNIAVAIWGAGIFWIGATKDYSNALFGWKIFILGIIFIAVFFYHVVYEFCGLKSPAFLLFLYFQGSVFLLVTFLGSRMTGSLIFLFHEFYYLKAGIMYSYFFTVWITIVSAGFFNLYKYIKCSSGLKRTQANYLFFCMLLGFMGGSTTALPAWGFNIYPFGHFVICLSDAVLTYAIFRYRLMDIRLALSNTVIFIGVYAFVLGIPFIFGYKYHLWQIATWAMLILATGGPFILFYLQRRAADRLLQEQRRYQTTLRQASAGMGKIKDLKKLLNMIVDVLINAIQIEHALIYVYDGGQKKYILGASKRKSGHNQFTDSIEEKSFLVQYLSDKKNSIIFEEIKQKAQDYKDLELTQIAQIIFSLEGDLLVPIFIDQNLIAIIIMGKRESGKLYSEDDLAVFSILANQTALAIENAQFYEKMKLTHEQLFQAEKMATIGTMADGLSHQINNRFHALGFIAGDALDTVHLNQNEPMSDKMKEIMTEFERAFVRVQDNVMQGGEIVQGLLKYTRKGEAGFTAIDVGTVFKAALEMAQFKIKTDQLKIIHDYDPASIPKIKANFTQLQEVFFNLIDNGYDAMMQRKNEQNEPGYQPTLIVHVLKEDGYAQVIFEDNGIGVKEEDTDKLFTPFFTTKLSSKKGTGLGLYVIKKIVEDNHGGTVEMISKYMQGTQMKLRLPIAVE